MKKLLAIALLFCLLPFVFARAELSVEVLPKTPELYTFQGIPWGLKADEFQDVVYEKTGIILEKSSTSNNFLSTDKQTLKFGDREVWLYCTWSEYSKEVNYISIDIGSFPSLFDQDEEIPKDALWGHYWIPIVVYDHLRYELTELYGPSDHSIVYRFLNDFQKVGYSLEAVSPNKHWPEALGTLIDNDDIFNVFFYETWSNISLRMCLSDDTSRDAWIEIRFQFFAPDYSNVLTVYTPPK